MLQYPTQIPGRQALVSAHLDVLTERYPMLDGLRPDITAAYQAMVSAFEAGGKLLVCGNGGSAADADHIVGELMKGFYKQRPLSAAAAQRLGPQAGLLQGALPAISLTHHTALSTAYLNDVEPTMGFAQQVYGYGREGDVFLGISTSGNSRNVVHAAQVAKACGLTTLGLTGSAAYSLASLCDICLQVPATLTAQVQELHLPVYHTLCAMLEEVFFD